MRGCVWLAATLLCLLAAAPRARSDEFATLVSDVAVDGFAAKERAVAALGKLGDGRAVGVLTALRDGRLLKAPDGRVLISDAAKKMTDPSTGANVPGVVADGLDRILVNNRLRGAIEAALGELTLFSTDPTARFAAAQDALRHPSADQAVRLEKAIAAEKDPSTRSAMEESLSAVWLVSGNKQQKLAAARALGRRR